MRWSDPIPFRTRSTSAPTASQRLAISFMKEMRVASIAFAAYLVISAEAMSMKMIGFPVRTNGAYSSAITLRAWSLSTPRTTRSGLRKSSTAAPSLRNSGLEHMWNGRRAVSATARWTFAAVPTGTVDFVTTTISRVMCRPITRATSSTWRRSAEPSSSGGVPTAMKTTSAPAIALPTSVVNARRSWRWLRSTSCSSPGS